MEPVSESGDSDSPMHSLVPSPFFSRRHRTPSMCERVLGTPEFRGTIKEFCREKGHGFITSEEGGEPIFVHISDVEDEFVPLPGDQVKYKLCPIPPKMEKFQAVHVHIVNLVPEAHKKWNN